MSNNKGSPYTHVTEARRQCWDGGSRMEDSCLRGPKTGLKLTFISNGAACLLLSGAFGHSARSSSYADVSRWVQVQVIYDLLRYAVNRKLR